MTLPRDRDDLHQTEVELTFEIPANANGGAVNRTLWSPGRPFRLDYVGYISHGGLATHADNFGEISLLKGATELAFWSTDTGADEDITTEVVTDLPFTAAEDADKVFAAGDLMKFLTEDVGTTTIPAATLIVRGRYVG